MSLNENAKIGSKKNIKISTIKFYDEEEEEEEEEEELNKDGIDKALNSNLPTLTPLYPGIKDISYFDENSTNLKILKLSEELPSLRKNNISLEEYQKQKQKNNFSDKFLQDLVKVPCKLSKSYIIEVISSFIRNSTLINKLESSYKWKNEEELNNLCGLISKNLTYEKFNKGDILFRIGDTGNKFYFILNGYVTILKLKEIPKVKMSYNQYFHLCLKLLKEKEYFILEETLKKNAALVPIKTIEQLQRIYTIIFKKKLYENIITDLVYNNNTLTSFFDSNEEPLEKYDINLRELQPFEYLEKIQEWKSYLIKRIKPAKDDLAYFDKYKEYIIRNIEMINITHFVYDDFLYLGAGFYFGENALEKGNIYTGGRRNATIRAETDIICASMKGADYLNIIEPKKRMEKMKEIKFIFSNFFFKNISVYLFEKNYFHLFSSCEYKKDDVVFTTGAPLTHLIFVKEGEVSYNINSSLINIQNLIRYLYDYIFKNEFFEKLPQNRQNNLLNNRAINSIKEYIDEPIFKKLKGFSIKFNEELNKKRNFKISTSGENDILGIEELYLNIACITKVTVLSKRLICYQINKEHIEQILYSEKEIALPFINASINKIVVLIQRLQNIKQHYIKYFMKKYEKNLDYEEQKNLAGNYNLYDDKLNLNNNNINSDLKLNSEINLDENNLNSNIEKDITNYNNIETNNNKSIVYKKEDNKSPLKMSLQLSNKISKKKFLNNLKKNINIKISDNNKIKPRNICLYNNIMNLKSIKRKKMYKTNPKFTYGEKTNKNLIIGDKNISISELKNRFNDDIQFLSEENIDLIQVIQSNKYNEANIYKLEKNKDKDIKSPIFKGNSNFLRYHLSYVPLQYNKLHKKNKNFNAFNTESLSSNLTTFQISIFSNKSNNINNNKIESRNNNLGNNNKDSTSLGNNQIIPKIIAKENDKKIQAKFYNSYNNNSRNIPNIYNIKSHEKIKGHINEKIKEFYDQLKSQGCLSYIPKNFNNTFLTRKFNSKYKSALKKNKFYSNNASQTDLTKSKKFLPIIKHLMDK